MNWKVNYSLQAYKNKIESVTVCGRTNFMKANNYQIVGIALWVSYIVI